MGKGLDIFSKYSDGVLRSAIMCLFGMIPGPLLGLIEEWFKNLSTSKKIVGKWLASSITMDETLRSYSYLCPKYKSTDH